MNTKEKLLNRKEKLFNEIISVLTPSEKFDWDIHGEIFLPVNRENCENGFMISETFTVYKFLAKTVEEYYTVKKECETVWNELREKHGGLYVRRYPTLDFNVTEDTPEDMLPEGPQWLFSFRVYPKSLTN